MKTTVLPLLLIALLPAGALRAENAAPSPAPAPEISFQETAYYAGESWEGEEVSHTFVFTNTGNAVLEISRVRSTCGCTASNLSSDRIAPGEKGEIRATFKTRGYRGSKSQPIYVTSNDPKNPTVTLKIETTVKTVAAFSPDNIQFDQVTHGQAAVRRTTLAFDSDPIPLRGISVQPDSFSVRTLEPEATEDGKTSPLRIEVTLSPEAPIGRHRGTLTVSFDREGLPDLTARLIASVEGLIQYTPRMLFFNEEDRAAKAAKEISVVNRGEKPISILAARSSIPQFQLEVETVKPGREFAVTVRLTPDTEPGRYAGEATIETDFPGQEAITIPLRANINR